MAELMPLVMITDLSLLFLMAMPLVIGYVCAYLVLYIFMPAWEKKRQRKIIKRMLQHVDKPVERS